MSEHKFCTLDFPPNLTKPLHSPTEDLTSPTVTLPLSPDIRDEETLYDACTEEVYLGPPLCYSMVLTKKALRFSPKRNECFSYFSALEPDYCVKLLSEEGPGSNPDDNLCYLSSCKESRLDVNQDSMYVHRFSPSAATEQTQTSLSSFLGRDYNSSSNSLPSNSASSSLQGPGSNPNDERPSLPPPQFAAEEEKGGENLYLLCDVAGGEVTAAVSVSVPQEERSHNEGPAYLNPRARVVPIDSSAAECLADTKMLESNMGAVMTKISVCSSATNPSKEPATAATRINPKINCSLMRECDRGQEEEEERQEGVDTQRVRKEEKGRRRQISSQQEEKTVATRQVSVPRIRTI